VNPSAPVEEAVAAATEARPMFWEHVVAGHTHAEKWRVALRGGGRAFVKAGTEPSARAQIDREASVLEAVAAPYMPRVHGASNIGDWSVLVLEDLSNEHWPPPYPDSGKRLLQSVQQLATTPPPPGLPRRPEGRPLGTYWQRIGHEPEPVLAHGPFSAVGRATSATRDAAQF
jgi:hypothetical protein